MAQCTISLWEKWMSLKRHWVQWNPMPLSHRKCVSRHRSGEGYKKQSATLKVPKSTVASLIVKWKKFGTTRTLPRAGRPAKLSNRGRRALERDVTKNPMVTELQRSCVEMGETSRRTTITITLTPIWASWHSGHLEPSPQWKTHKSSLGVCKKAPKVLSCLSVCGISREQMHMTWQAGWATGDHNGQEQDVPRDSVLFQLCSGSWLRWTESTLHLAHRWPRIMHPYKLKLPQCALLLKTSRDPGGKKLKYFYFFST